MTKQNITRRAALASGAAAASMLAAIPAIAATPAARSLDVTCPDLAARFTAIRARWAERREFDRVEGEKIDALIFRDTGYTRETRPEFNLDDPAWNAYHETAQRIGRENSDDELDEHGGSIAWTKIHNELFPLVAEIMDRAPNTLGDIVLQAQAAALANSELWDADDPAAQGDAGGELFLLVESICDLAGVKPLPEIGDAVPAFALAAPCPVLAAIDNHRAAYRHLGDALNAMGEYETAHLQASPDDDERARLDVAVDDAHEREGDALLAVLTTAPATIGGVVAALRYVRELKTRPAESPLDRIFSDEGEGSDRVYGADALVDMLIRALSPHAAVTA